MQGDEGLLLKNNAPMTIEAATAATPSLVLLQGRYSESYKATIDNVFTSFMDSILAYKDYEARKAGMVFPHRPEDKGRYTVVAALSDGKIVSIKSVVMGDKMENYDDLVKSLDYMNS